MHTTNNHLILFFFFLFAYIINTVSCNTCYGKTGILACGGVGTCSSNGLCICPQGYSGQECNSWACSSELKNSTNVCSSRGNCTAPDTCVCSSSKFSGQQCEVVDCFGLTSADSRSCGGKGKCVEPDVCSCSIGYKGTTCDQSCAEEFCPPSSPTRQQSCSASSLQLYLSFETQNQTLSSLGYVDDLISGDLAELDNVTLKHEPSFDCGGMAASFELQNAQVVLSKNLTLGSTFTIEFRFKLAKSYSGINYDQYLLWLYQDAPSVYVRSTVNKLLVEVKTATNVVYTMTFNGDYRDDLAHHLLITRKSDNQFVAVLDNYSRKEVTIAEQVGTFTQKRKFTYSMILGANKDEMNHMYGAIDEVKIWNCGDEYGIISSCPTCSNVNQCSSIGKCVAKDTCLCPASFEGTQCQYPVCFGKNSSNPLVCSGQGVCQAVNNCSCSAGYTSTDCSVPICNGKPATDSSVCSSHGTCTAPNTCSCSAGYTGSNCNIPICSGIPASNSSVCSSHGSCIAPSVCSCSKGWQGATCDQIDPLGIECFGLNATDPRVCSGVGRCINWDTCNCTAGNTGTQCEIPVCFGIAGNLQQACSGRGFCISTDACMCNTGYSGPKCSTISCYGKYDNDTLVCSGNGRCVSPNSCQCNAGYQGSDCSGFHCNDVNQCSLRGQCVGANKCDCTDKPSWTGSNCTIPICYGFNATDSRVCSSKGTCTAPGQCQCQANSFGSQCDLVSCFGILSNSSSVCGAKGKCVGTNQCQCITGYSGAQCELISCNGFLSTSPAVCNFRNGTCVGPDTCQCGTKYAGFNCHIPLCYGKLPTAPNVCSGRGTCVAPNQCICRSGYSGTECEFVDTSDKPACFGQVGDDPLVCSGQGNCTSVNNCTCKDGYEGSMCQNPLCFGISSQNSLAVCSGNGLCIGVNNCNCKAGFSGAQCEKMSCYGVLSTEPSVCSGRGSCIAPDTCICSGGYFGDCNQRMCFNRNQSDPLVCSGKGTCDAPNSCRCNNGTFGPMCEYYYCYGMSNTDSRVCSSNGVCTNFNQCSCKPGYTGDQCQTPVCYGLLASDPSVCGARGTCTAPNTCSCPTNWNGDLTCTTCSRNVEGPNCDIPRCDQTVTCKNNGICNMDTLQCVCFDSDSAGHWTSTFCDKCSTNYYGTKCKTLCLSNTNCVGHGDCNPNYDETNQNSTLCTCYDSDVRGHFTGASCTGCQPGWYGLNCNNYVPASLSFNANGDKLYGDLLLDTVQYSLSASCSEIFSASTTAALGTDAKCWWPKRAELTASSYPDDPEVRIKRRYFEVIFGQGATFRPSTPITFVNNLLPSITATLPADIIKPVAQIDAPKSIGVCDTLQMNGITSFSADRRPLSFTWEVISGYNVPKIQAQLSISPTYLVSLPSSLLEPGFDYVFSLKVTNYLSVTSETTSVTVKKSASPVPIASIAGPKLVTVYHSDYLKLEGSAIINTECFYENKEIAYTWAQTEGPKVAGIKSVGKNLIFTPFSFPKLNDAQTYTFELKVQPLANLNVYSTESVSVRVVPRPVKAAILGGKLVKESITNVLSIDGRGSYDPDKIPGVNETYSWQCFDKFGGICAIPDTVDMKAAVLQIPAMTLTAGTYTFQLTYAKGIRVDSDTTTAQLIRAIPPKVFIRTVLPQKVNRNERLSVVATVTVPPGYTADELIYKWTITNSRGEMQFNPDQLLTSLNQPVLSLKPNVLEYGERYGFQLTVTGASGRRSQLADEDQSGTAVTSEPIVNTPPMPGAFIVEPSSGVSMETQFTLLCSQWIDDDVPLQYAFSYYTPSNTNPVILAKLSPSSQQKMFLPVGDSANNYTLIIEARVVDTLGATTVTTKTIRVLPLVQTNTDTGGEKPQVNQTAVLNSVQNKAADLLTSGNDLNIDSVSQIVGNIVQLINVPKVTPTPAPGNTSQPTENPCPNKCSGHGTCIIATKTCECTDPYTSSDCSITKEELEQRKSLRSLLLTSLVQTFSSSVSVNEEPVTKDVLNQQTAIVEQIASQPEELSTSTKSLAMGHLDNLLTFSVEIDTNVATTVGSTLSNLASTIFVAPPAATNTTSNTTSESPADTSKKLSGQLLGVVDKLLGAIAGSKLPGEEPTLISQPQLQLKVQKEYPKKLEGLNVAIPQADNKPSPSVKLPKNMSSQLKKPSNTRSSLYYLDLKQSDTGSDYESVDVQMTNYVNNPYAWSPKSDNISSGVLSFSLKADNAEIKVYNLSQPIQFVIPNTEGKIDLENGDVKLTNDGCLLTDSSVVMCRYWDVISETWRSDGCQIINVTSAGTICECNHLTDFASFIEYITPEMNIIKPEDFKLLATINADNMTTLGVMIGLNGAYIILFFIGIILDRLFSIKSRAEFEARRDQIQMGRVRMFLEQVKSGHLWISYIFRPNTATFSRSQRVTVIFIIIELSLMLNALFFGTHQSNIARTIVAGIVSNLISVPPTLILTFLFSSIAPYWKKQVIAPPPAVQVFGNHLTEFEDEDILPVAKAVKEAEELKAGKKPVHAATFSEMPTGLVLGTQTEKPLWDLKVEREISDRVKERQEKRDRVKRLTIKPNELPTVEKPQGPKENKIKISYDKTVDLIDNKLDQAEILIKNKVSRAAVLPGIIILVVALIFYFVLIIVFITLMEIYFKSVWLSYFSTGVALVSVLILFLSFEVIYIIKKREKYRLTKIWKTNHLHLLYPIGGMVAGVIGILVCLIIIFSNIFNLVVVYHCLIAIACFLIYIISCVMFIVLTHVKPNINQAVQPPVRIGIFPWWVQLFVYPLAWAIMVVCSLILVIYGLKFGPAKEKAWLGSSFISLGQDMIITKPIKVVAKAFVFTVVVSFIQNLFFGDGMLRKPVATTAIEVATTANMIAEALPTGVTTG